MSDLAKQFAKSKLASLPSEPPLHEDPEAPEDDYDSSSASSMSSTGTVIPTSSQRPAPTIPWSDYFTQELYLERHTSTADHAAGNPNGGSGVDVNAKFHVYLTPPRSAKAPLLVLHHGAGSSGLSFALCAKELRKLLPEAGILAVDAREHGSVVWGPDGHVDSDLSIDVLSADLVDMLGLTQARMGWKELPRVVLVGHSLGGAVVTHTANQGLLGDKVLGYAVLDVVEGSAMEALKHMQTYLATRPKSFATLDAAIDWHIRTRTLRNPQSARASVPSLLVQTPEGRWTWKTELGGTKPFWENWFAGMSAKFLGGKGAKLLMLAGTDRLDKELMIGQMQGMVYCYYCGIWRTVCGFANSSYVGKFQLHVFPEAGHFIQEDLPLKTAEVVVEFVKRNDRSTLVLPPKVSDLLAQGKKV
jgi:protein phosphatase methylesterase 1